MTITQQDNYNTDTNESAKLPALEATIPLKYAGERLDRVLASLFPDYSRSRLSQWIEAGVVQIDQQTVQVKQAKKPVSGGEKVTIQPQPSPDAQAFQPENIELNIVHEDDALIVINKPAGLIVHPGHGNWSGTLLNALLYHCPSLASIPRAGIVHRLDKDTSGLLVVAKTLTAQTDLVRQLQARTVKREYQALVWGCPAMPGQEHRIETWMGRHPQQRIKMSVRPEGFGKPALTFYKVERSGTHYSWVFCRLASGRTHQIRVHMAHLGHPVLGDTLYGRRHDDFHQRFGQHALHAYKLSFEHPTQKRTVGWKTLLPEPIDAFIEEQGWREQNIDMEWKDEDWEENDEWLEYDDDDDL
ncbi:MAG: RluA family pseudouridine synthase [Pseudomonadota bacterium]